MFESGSNCLLTSTTVVVGLGFGRRNVPDRLKQPVVVEPGDSSIPADLSGEPLNIAILERGLHESKIMAKMKDGMTENGFVLETSEKWRFHAVDSERTTRSNCGKRLTRN